MRNKLNLDYELTMSCETKPKSIFFNLKIKI